MKGVYQIRNTVNGKKYIGSSENIKRRWGEHKSELRGNYHGNPYLQRAWNKHGENAFVFEVLEKTKNTLKREQWYLDNIIKWRHDYNIGRDAIAPMRGRLASEETKRKMRESHHAGLRGKKNGMWGKHHSREAKKKISEALSGEKAHNSKLTEGQVWKIHAKYATGSYTHKELAVPLFVNHRTIGDILRGNSWKHVYEKFHQR